MNCPYCGNKKIWKISGDIKRCSDCKRSFNINIMYRSYITIGRYAKVLSFSNQLLKDLNFKKNDKINFVINDDELFIYATKKGKYQLKELKNGQNVIRNRSLLRFLKEYFNLTDETYSLIIKNNRVMKILSRSEIDRKYKKNFKRTSNRIIVNKKGGFLFAASLCKSMKLGDGSSLLFYEENDDMFVKVSSKDSDNEDDFKLMPAGNGLQFTNIAFRRYLNEKYKLDSDLACYLQIESTENENEFKLFIKQDI